MQILNSLIPIFAVIGLGILLRWNQFLSAETTQGFNRFAYYFALPLFLFYKLAAAPAGAGTANLFLTTLLSATVVTTIVSWIVTGLLGTKEGARGAMVQASFRGNLAFIGLPLVFFTIYDLPEDQRDQIQSAIMIAIVPVMIFFNVASVAVLAIYNQQTETDFSWGQTARNIATNPLIAAVVAGAFFQSSELSVPTAVVRTCEVIGASAFALALLGIGSQLASISVAGQWGNAFIVSLIKCVLCPLVGFLVARSLGLEGIELQVILILCAVPTAVSSYVLTEQMQGDADLAASAVVVCTAFSLFTLSVLLILTG